MAKKSIEQRYQKLSPEEQVLKRPDTYVGAVILQDKSMWCANKLSYTDDIKITKQDVIYTPALLKLYDEILTNASDHANRPKTNVKNIKINVDKDWNVTIYNDGSGIPIVKHKEHKVYVPELIFCHLFSGENYDDDNDFRYGAGRNGLGSKLVSLFSDNFIIDCADGKKKYYQKVSNNNKNKEKPKITASKQSYTSISYKADFNRLELGDKISQESLIKLFIKRAIDIAVYNPKVNVYFNDVLININSMEDWCKLHINTDEIFIEKYKNFSIALTHTPTHKFEQCSIVNGNTTWDGGTYIDGIMKQLYTELIAQLTKGKKGIKLKPNDIKSKFQIFVIAKIANPVFDTQTKEKLTLKTDLPILPKPLYKKLLNSSIVESILQWIELKEQQALKKINNKSAGKSIRVPKLLDAHKAGTVTGYKSALCITEGDCVEENTQVKVFKDGDYVTTKIKDVNIGDMVITHNGNVREVYAVTKTVKKSKHIHYNNTKITASEEHKLLVYNKQTKTFNYIKVIDINKNIHQLVKSKLYNLEALHEILDIIKSTHDNFDKTIILKDGKIESTESHKFTIFNIDEGKFELLPHDKIKIGDLIVSVTL